MNTLQILSKDIRQVDGLYCLNDLHKAAGSENKKRPSFFLDSKQSKELIHELEIAGIPAISKKKGVGTFASKEVVLSYGMWINSKVNLAVIRAFLDRQEQAIDQQFLEATKTPTLTPIQQRHVQKRVAALVKQQIGTTYSGMWGSIKDKFHVGTYKDIDATKYPDVCEFLQCEPIEKAIFCRNVLALPEGIVAINENRLNELMTRIDTLNQCVNTIDKVYGDIVDATNEVVFSINYPHPKGELN